MFGLLVGAVENVRGTNSRALGFKEEEAGMFRIVRGARVEILRLFKSFKGA